MERTRSTAEQIDLQIRRWHVLQRTRIERRPPRCVALSRLPGSGAAGLGLRVAEKLDYGFFGIELVDQIARERGVDRLLLEHVDEHVRSAIERYVGDAFRRGVFSESEYLRHVVRAITTLGQRGGAVVLGRGSPYILSREQALRVLVVAPREDRVARIARDQQLEPAAAARVLDQRESERLAFLKHHFSVDPDDPSLYDMVVNTGTLGMATAADLVLSALEAGPPA